MPQLTRFLRGAGAVPPLILVLPSALWAQAAVDLMGVLELGQPIEATLGAGEVHRWNLEVSEREVVVLRVDQFGVDVVVSVVNPGGEVEVEVDGPGVGEPEGGGGP